MLNLLTDACFPVRRANGKIEPIHIWRLGETDNPPEDFQAPRPDLRAAMYQFAIGVLQTAMTPADKGAWRAHMRRPPTPDALRARIEPFAPAFELMGSGPLDGDPRFMQDLTLKPEESKAQRIGSLLIEAPGGNTLKQNIDHFVKRGRVRRISPFWTAMALFCLQTNAPSGGKGHRTGLRGGGPLTTLIRRPTLWQTLWLAVLEQRDFFVDEAQRWANSPIESLFPWLRPTLTSEKGTVVDPLEHHPAHLYWAMPRRIRLDPPQIRDGICHLSGEAGSHFFESYITKSYGNHYGEQWQHPLTPHYQDPKKSFLPIHGQPGGVGYRHWLGLVFKDSGRKQQLPAKVIALYPKARNRLPDGAYDHHPTLWAFGYDMDNAKARAWIDAVMPVVYPANADLQEAYQEAIKGLIGAAEQVASTLRQCYKLATTRPGLKLRGNLSLIDDTFWSDTETRFYQTAEALARDPEDDGSREDWLKHLAKYAMDLFDRLTSVRAIETVDPEILMQARAKLAQWTAPSGKKLRGLLNLPDKTKAKHKES